MAFDKLLRWSGFTLVLGGVCLALFVLIHPFGDFHVEDMATDGRQVLAHSFHLVGYVLVLFGLVGLYARQMDRTGNLGLIGFLLAFLGTATFIGLVAQAVVAFPVAARHAPDLVAPDGALITAPPPPVVALGLVAYYLGYIVLAIAPARSNVFPLPAAVLLGVGAVLFSVPPEPIGPAPYIVPFLGGLIFGAAMVWLGLKVWSRVPELAR